MQVTLKKAAEISRALLAAAKAVDYTTNVSVSVYSTSDVESAVSLGGSAVRTAAERVTKMVDAGFNIRKLVGAANASAGIDDLLTDVARVDERIARLTSLTVATPQYGGIVGVDDMEAVNRRVSQARRDATDTSDAATRRFGGNADAILLNVVSASMRDQFAATVLDDKRERTRLKDEITARNFTTKVTIPEDIVTILTDEKII